MMEEVGVVFAVEVGTKVVEVKAVVVMMPGFSLQLQRQQR